MNIRVVTIIGANGTMGASIAGLFASFGNAKVYMAARKIEDAEKALNRAGLSVKAETITHNLIPVSYERLPQCLAESDLIMESVSENKAIKMSVYKMIDDCIPSHAIVATGTSGLSIDFLAEQLSESNRAKFFGVHFFNPPYSMTLCELIPSIYSDKSKLPLLKEYLKTVLFRTVVEVKNTAAFMGNRIGFQFINLALQFAETYKQNGGIDYIDAILGGFTGRAMAPLTTSDFVGLDVHKAIVDNIYENLTDYEKESFVMPEFATALINEGRLGRKVGCGLYKLEKTADGKKQILVYDIETNQYRPKKKYSFTFVETMVQQLKIGKYRDAYEILIHHPSAEAHICLEFLLRYAFYGIFVAKEIGDDAHSADKVMATGFNWIPPLCVYQVLNSIVDFKELAKKVLPKALIQSIDIDTLLQNIPVSEYDYRPFIKAKG